LLCLNRSLIFIFHFKLKFVNFIRFCKKAHIDNISKMKELTKNYIIETLHSLKKELESNYGVARIALVGSFAREEYTKGSDIDFLVEFSTVTFNNLAGLNIFLEKIFGKKTDIIIKSPYLKKKLLESVEKDAAYA